MASALPEKLFHASTHPENLEQLEPRPEHNAVGQEGNFVFATDDPVIAAAYSLKTDDMLFAGKIDDEAVVVLSSIDNIEAGRIYTLPTESFTHVHGGEFTSEQAVTPLETTLITSTDKPMEEGVQVMVFGDAMNDDKWWDFREESAKTSLAISEQGDVVPAEVIAQELQDLKEFLAQQIEKGDIIHLNAERGINAADLSEWKAANDEQYARNTEEQNSFVNSLRTNDRDGDGFSLGV